MNTPKQGAASGQVAGTFKQIETASKGMTSAVTTDLDKLNKAVANSGNQMGVWSRAFRGAFIGAVAGIAFSTIVSGITGIASATFDAGKAAVQAAADFQVTRNAFVVYTGSISAAKAELRDIAQIARNTPGLRLEDAEQGAKNLRALGFQAKLSLDLVEGLAKQKILSGADEGAVNRVIVNLTQLASGSPRASQDIREMIQSIRTLRPELIATFGSIDEFRRQIAQDPELALGKFAQGLKDTQIPAAGLTDATYKLLDAWMVAGRTFGDPILDPLTDSLKILTTALNSNGSAWAAWGQNIGDAIRGANQLLANSPFLRANSNVDPILTGLASLGPIGWVGAAAYDTYREMGKSERLRLEEEARQRSLEGEPALRRQLGVAYGPVSEDMIGERNVELERQRAKRANDQERARREYLANMDTFHKSEQAELRANYASQAAIRRSGLDLTVKDEISTAKALGAIKQKQLSDTLALTIKQNKEVFASGKLTQQESIALAREQDALVAETSALKLQAAAETNAQLNRLEQQRIEDARRAAIELKNLEMDAVQDRYDAAAYYIERQIDLNDSGFGELIDITQQSYADIYRITSEQYALRLQDARLTSDQIVNIEKEQGLALARLTEQNAQRILQIQDRAFEAQARKLRENQQNASQFRGAMSGIYQSIQSQIQPGAFFGAGLPDIGFQSISGTLASTVRQIQGGYGAGQTFYGANEAIQKKIHDIQKENLTNEIQLNKDLLDIEKQRIANALQLEIVELRRREAVAIGNYDKATQGGADQAALDNMKADIEALQKLIRERGTYLGDIQSGVRNPESSETRRLTTAGRLLQLQKEILEVDQAIEHNQLEQSLHLDKIKSQTQEILSGKRDSVLQQLNELNAASRYRDVAVEYQQQEVLLRDKATLSIVAETAALEELTSVRREEIDAVKDLGAAHVRISQQMVYSQTQVDASVAKFIASQKGITEIVSDAKIGVLQTAYSGLEGVAERLTRKFGAFRDVIKDLIANMLKLAFNRLFGNLFAPGGSGAGGGLFGSTGGSGGGFNIGSIFGGFGGGIGPGGTPYFNPGGGGFSTEGEALLNSIGTWGGGNGASVLLGQASRQGGTLGGAIGAGGGLLGGLGSGVGMLLPLLGAGIGSSLGGQSGLGRILGGVGGGILGAIGGTILTGGGLLAALPGSLGATLLPLLLNPFTAIAAAALIPAALILGRNAARRRDERTRNQAMLDAFAAIDKLIKDVNGDRIDGAQAIEQAEAVRQQYLDQMGQLKDKKTRNIALKEVSRIDAKISELKTAVQSQVARRERLELMVPTFAYGGRADGYQMGAGHGTSDNLMRYFPAARTFGYTSPTEYVLDADTTRNIGVQNLDLMRATKGQSYAAMRKNMVTPRMAGGGMPIPSSSIYGTPQTTTMTSGSPVTLEVTMNVTLGAETLIEVVQAAMKNNDGSREQINTIISSLKNEGEQNALLNYIREELSKR